jgi:hypothetical protein
MLLAFLLFYAPLTCPHNLPCSDVTIFLIVPFASPVPLLRLGVWKCVNENAHVGTVAVAGNEKTHTAQEQTHSGTPLALLALSILTHSIKRSRETHLKPSCTLAPSSFLCPPSPLFPRFSLTYVHPFFFVRLCASVSPTLCVCVCVTGVVGRDFAGGGGARGAQMSDVQHVWRWRRGVHGG